MTAARTDAEQSLETKEFEWLREGLSDVHRFVLPVLRDVMIDGDYDSILDLGCGNGALTHELTKHCGNCTGTDMSTSGIEIATRSYPAAEFCVSNIEEPLPPRLFDRFDAVIAVEVIEHLLLPRQLFARAKEALKHDGELILSAPYHGYFKNLALALSGKFDSHWHPLRDYGHVKFFSLKTLTSLFEEQGFELKGVWRVGRVRALARSMIVRGKRIG